MYSTNSNSNTNSNKLFTKEGINPVTDVMPGLFGKLKYICSENIVKYFSIFAPSRFLLVAIKDPLSCHLAKTPPLPKN